jgi:hypothetical protein
MTILNPNSLSSSETRVNRGIRNWKSTHLKKLDVRKQLVLSNSQKAKSWLGLYNFVYNSTVPNPGSKWLSSNASPG